MVEVLSEWASGDNDLVKDPLDLHRPRESAASAIYTIYGSRFGIEEKDVKTSLLSGGITNCLVKVTAENPHTRTNTAIVRIHGRDTERLVYRVVEQLITDFVAGLGFGKRVYTRFPNGQVEEWLSGRAITTEEMRDPTLSRKIATRMAQLHSVEIEPSFVEKIGKQCYAYLTEEFSKVDGHAGVDKMKSIMKEDGVCGSWFWPRLFLWHALANEAFNASGRMEGEWSDVRRRLSDLLGGLCSDMLSLFDKHERYVIDNAVPVVLGHNDLLDGNIIRSDTGDVQFIDFEYSNFGHRGFDIANHFMEYAGFPCDLSLFPSPTTQRRFVEQYLSEVRYNSAREESGTEDDVTRILVNELPLEFQISNLFWGLWASLSSVYSHIDFDYEQYAVRRLSAFYNPKFAAPLAASYPSS